MTYINTVSTAKQPQLQEVQLPLLQPFKINEAAGQRKAQKLQGSEQPLAISRADANAAESS